MNRSAPNGRPNTLPLAPEQRLVRPETAADMLDVSRTKLYELLKSGELVSIKVGGSRRVPITAIDAYIATQLSQAAAAF